MQLYQQYLSAFLIGFLTIQCITAFDSGLSPEEPTTHYGLTACALVRIAASYLQSVYKSTRLTPHANSTAFCMNYNVIFFDIQREIRRLNLISEFSSTVNFISISNIDVNVEESTSAPSHFANEQFAEASRLVELRLTDVVAKVTDNASSLGDAYRSFGQALHTIQDFYSHSNWVELGRKKPCRQIGTDVELGIYAPRGLETCNNCTDGSCAENNIRSEIISGRYLTSGYYSYSPSDPPKPRGKCSHGGLFDSTTRTDAIGYGINKDNIYSDHGSYHFQAANVALAATMEQLQSLWTTVGDEAFGRFLGFHPTNLVITLDTTGSMSPVINMVKEIIIRILNYTQQSDALLKPSKYIFSPFNDPEWGPLTITSDVEFLIAQIRNLTANGGGDAPELYYHGLYEALQVCGSNAVIFTFTDAPAKDTYLRSQVFARARELGVKIFSFYVGSITRSNNHPWQRDLAKNLDGSAIEDIAIATGGLTIGLNPSTDRDAIMSFIFHHFVPRQSILSMQKAKTINRTFLIDSNLTVLSIDLSSSTRLSLANRSSFYLIDPRGSIVHPTLETSSGFFQLYRIDVPSPGLWRVISDQSSPHAIEITVPENLTGTPIITCRIRLNQKVMRESNWTYGSLTMMPIINQSDVVVMVSCSSLPSPLQSALISFVDQSGLEISQFSALRSHLNDSIIAPVIIPGKQFRIVAQITLTDGSVIQRESSAPITPSSLSITVLNQPYIFQNSTANNVTFNVTNHAQEALLIEVCVVDTLSFLGINGSCQNYTINSMTILTGNVEIYVNVENESSITTGSMTFSIRSLNSTGERWNNQRRIPFYIQTREYNATSYNSTDIVEDFTSSGDSVTTDSAYETATSEGSDTTDRPYNNLSSKDPIPITSSYETPMSNVSTANPLHSIAVKRDISHSVILAMLGVFVMDTFLFPFNQL